MSTWWHHGDPARNGQMSACGHHGGLGRNGRLRRQSSRSDEFGVTGSEQDVPGDVQCSRVADPFAAGQGSIRISVPLALT